MGINHGQRDVAVAYKDAEVDKGRSGARGLIRDVGQSVCDPRNAALGGGPQRFDRNEADNQAVLNDVERLRFAGSKPAEDLVRYVSESGDQGLRAHDILRRQDPRAVNVRDKVRYIVVGGRRQDLRSGTYLDDRALAHDHNALPDAHRFIEIVGDKYDRSAELSIQRNEQILHFAPSDRIERRERLVHEHNLGIGGEGTGESHSLLHAPGKLCRVGVLPATQAHLLQRPVRAFTLLLCASSPHMQPVGDVFTDRAVRENREVLEDHAEPLIADLPQLTPAECVNVSPIQFDRPSRRLNQAIQKPYDGRLAGARQPHDDEQFTAEDFEADPANRDRALSSRQDLVLVASLVQ